MDVVSFLHHFYYDLFLVSHKSSKYMFNPTLKVLFKSVLYVSSLCYRHYHKVCEVK